MNMTIKTKRHSPGSYSVGLGGLDPQQHYVATVKYLDHLKGWMAAAGWDHYRYSDPLPTYREAKRSAERMLQEAAIDAKRRVSEYWS